jgi:exonuclease III
VFVDDIFLACVVDVSLNGDGYVVFAVYRPHSDSIESFSSKLVEMLNPDVLRNTKVILLGDFNINILDQDSVSVSCFIADLYSLSFLPFITKAT